MINIDRPSSWVVTCNISLGSLSPSLFSARILKWYEVAGCKLAIVATVWVPGTTTFEGCTSHGSGRKKKLY